MTTEQKAMDEGGRGAVRIELYGRHHFVALDQVPDWDDVAWIRLSRYGWTPCFRGEEAEMRAGFLRVHEEADGRTDVDLPSGFGLLGSRSGEIVGAVLGSGKVVGVQMGDLAGGDRARMSLCSLDADEAFEQRRSFTGASDLWALGRPVA